MTRAVSRDRVLKEDGDISDHLRNHIHLTNCIHLKNHMHKLSPLMSDRSLVRDLMVLQRSRSLRDPSASPLYWHSPLVADLLSKKVDKDGFREGRRSVGVERPRNGRRLSISSPALANFPTSKVASGEEGSVCDRSSKSADRDSKRIRTAILGENNEPVPEQDGKFLSPDGSKNWKGKRTQGIRTKTLSEQLNDLSLDSDDVASSNVQVCGRHEKHPSEEREVSIRGYSSGLNRENRRKFQRARRSRAAPREVGGRNELSVDSNSFGQGSMHPKYGTEEEDNVYDVRNVRRAPRNGCGIPLNWSRIHHRGKTFLDIAGRSFSCGLSDCRLRKRGEGFHARNAPEIPVESDQSSSSAKFNTEALPLLIETSGSQNSMDNARWANDYSGEVGIFADSLLKHNVDSDLVSVDRSSDQSKLAGNHQGRHQSITQKYMPRTFRDLVGQNLVSQALSNAVTKRKVGLLYVFYGPHGTGKSSCSWIFARALNCQSLEQTKPCGFCDSCISIDMGKNRNIREVGPVSNFDFESIMDLLDNMNISQQPSQYRVFIFDDCDTLSPDCWSAISKVIDRSPRRVVLILVCSNLDILPHIIMSRCQKFFFPKLKDADIIYTLQWIAPRENIEIERDALKLIASRSDGSLRDAEMTLEQLSLLGQKISVQLVQELVGLISDEKLVDLLDLALSADTVNTVKSLRLIMESGVEPLALMSQLATVITDILASSYEFTKERHRRKFFRRQPLLKEDMEKLRQALKTLSEAEKQLRLSNDKLTWLTAALLQLAPNQQYILPISSTDTNSHNSPLPQSDVGGTDIPRERFEFVVLHDNTRGLSMNARSENLHAGSPEEFKADTMNDINLGRNQQSLVNNRKRIEDIWFEVLENIQVNSLKEFLFKEGKLISVSFGVAPTVQLMFSSHMTRSKANIFRGHISQAFESVLGSPLTIEIRCETNKDATAGFRGLHVLPSPLDGQSPVVMDPESNSQNRMHEAGSDDTNKRVMGDRDSGVHVKSPEAGRGEIVEIAPPPRQTNDNEHDDEVKSNRRGSKVADAAAYRKPLLASTSEREKPRELTSSQSIVRRKVPLAQVIHQGEGSTQLNGRPEHKAVSIAEKLEQESLRLEPRSRSLLCLKASRVTRRKLSRLKIGTRRSHSLLKLVCCGHCHSSKSPR
ncbi:Protein STICHEL-like 3 [Hibiscus syriacus]|uniref:Protein STICHEL-like 3 n=1 Tax=Hibiscus syriacus TaxID=106335 RepID=A0A6A2ZFY3_HIBSY|nr:protein STICHEL-like 4 [Hibiscus syriacus]KAE8689855.1 Protein STICHEL-like 3 [Hibiscus syriacus]